MALKIVNFPTGPLSTNTYIIYCTETRLAAVVDPGLQCHGRVDEFIRKFDLIPQKILLTHSHWDHFGDAAFLKEEYDIPLYVHKMDAENVEDPGADGLPLFYPIKACLPDSLLEDGQLLQLGNHTLQVIHTPGHSPGGVCFYCKEEGVLLSGDTLFKGTMGRVDFPSASPDAMSLSLKKLSKLPADTKVYPGHGNSTTIGAESWIANTNA